MKDAAKKSYMKKGQDVVEMNYKAIDAGATAYREDRRSRRLGQRRTDKLPRSSRAVRARQAGP